MTEAIPTPHHSFAVQKTVTDPERRPLEVYHLSHDLRGPLNSMLGFCELLLEGVEGPLSEVQQVDISAIYQSAQNLLELINTVIDLSKLEANRLNFNFGPVNLDQVILEMIDAGFGSLKPEEVELTANLIPPPSPVRADRDRVEQMIKAMLRFAFKLKRKGQITLATGLSDTQEVILCMDIEGVELPQAELAELFELVIKIDPAGRSELGRGGLELPLVRSLAEKQQGRAWAENGEERHLTLYLSLPRYEPGSKR